MLVERFHQRVELGAQATRQLRHMGGEMRRAIFGQHHLLQRAGAGIGLQRQHPRHHFPGRDDEADPQRRRDRFGKGADVDDAAMRAHGVDRGRALAGPDQIGVAIVFEDRHAVFLRQLQQLRAAGFRHDGAGRVLHGRDGVDVFRRDAAPLVVGECCRQRIHPHAVVVEGNADRLDAEPRQPVQRALIGFLLDQHGVAARQQRVVDEVERLQRTRNDHDVVSGAGDAGIALEFCGEEFAQGTIALRAAGEAVGRERLALAPEHGTDRLDQAVDGDLIGVVVAADETVFGETRPPRRRRRQAGWQQWRKIEGGCGTTWIFTPVLFFR